MNELKVNVYSVLEECVENGIERGWIRAYKHTDNPTENQLKEEIYHYIMLTISEKFIFDD